MTTRIRNEEGQTMSKAGNDADYIQHPLAVAGLGEAQMVVFPKGQGSALVYGEPTEGTLVRLQSACQYGEIYGSLACDCRPQLDASLTRMAEAGSGVLIHLLAHEGRGSGLRAKARAYHDRQHHGLNTYESYEQQCIPDDQRNYDVATVFLKNRLDLHRVSLLTNNPSKVDALEASGIIVDRIGLVPIAPGSRDSVSAECGEYLRVKAAHGHLIPWTE